MGALLADENIHVFEPGTPEAVRQTEALRAALREMGPGSKVVSACARGFVVRAKSGAEKFFGYPEPQSRAQYAGLPDQVGGICL